MESDITESLRSIIKDLDKNLENSNVANESYRILIHFHKYLEEDEINEIALDNYLLFIFNKEHGIVQFVQTVLTKTIFKKSKVQCIELFYLLVNNFSSKMEKHFREINKLCLIVLKTLCTTSEEKVKALTLISLMLEVLHVNFAYTDDYMDLLNTLQHCRSLKLGESIMEKIFECIGLYVKHLDYTLKIEDTKNLQNILFVSLNREMLNKDYSNKSVAGLLTGLKHMQERVSFQPVEDEKQINELYGIIKKLSQDAFKSRIKMHCRAALLFLQKSIALFQDNLYRDDKFWNDTLLKWITSLGAEEKKVASKVILSFYSSICSCLMREQTPQHKKQLMRYLILFRKTIDEPTSTNLEKQTCIHGLRIFFKAAPVLLDPKDVSNFSHKLLHKFRMTYIENQEFLSDEWALLPDYVQMVACISISKGIDRGEILLLQQTLIALLKHYSHIPILLRFKVNRAFLVIVHMFKSYDFFDSFLSDLIYHCVIWSCSHQHVSEINEDNQETVTILTYLPFWKEILNSKWKSYDRDFELDLEDWRSMTPQIVKKLIASLFISVDKLDVTMSYKECDSTDMKQLVEINKKDDFAIFLNIVDFYERLCLSTNPEFLEKYIYRVLNFIMGRSLKYPLISGFYRLLASFLKIANKINYFSDNENEQCYEALSTFMQHLMPAVTQYEDELLISCLKVLLECPPSIIEDMLPACVTPFVTVFTMGRHYLPVADLGIETLQTWQQGIRHDLMEDFVGNVVQKLDPFLRSKSLAYLAPEFEKRAKSHRALGKRKMAVEIEPELVKLQRKMVRFLGRQSGSVCEKMLDGRRIVSDVWGDAEHLKVALPFPDTKLEIYFDQMVPLVVELALYSSDRRTRVTSCELLQALVVLFLGIGRQVTDKVQEEMAGVLKKFSSAILELGSDPDEVVKALFEPLVFQMVHWYANVRSGKCHAVIIFEALIEGISSSTNPNLRTFSGKCIGEFVKWTIKQWPSTSSVPDPITIKALVRKMRFLSTHPDKFKKLGAALIFNNIYVFLREERSLLSMFWIEIFEIFVSSLNFIEDNFENRPVVAQVNTALKNLQRGFTEKVALFKLKDERRRKPFGFEGTSPVDVLNFLLGNVKSKHHLCREKSAELLRNLLPFLGHDQYLQEALKNPSDWLECPAQLEITQIPQLLCFMSELHRELDLTIFLLTTSIHLDLNSLGTFPTVAYYLELVATRRIEDVFGENERMTLLDKRVFVNQTNEINGKILVLSSHILEKNSHIDHLWNGSLWRLVTLLTFSQNEEDARKELKHFLNNVHKLPEQKLEELKDHLVNHIKSNFKDHLELNTRISSKQKTILNGMIYLKNFNFNITSLYPRIVRNFVEKCLANARASIYLGEDEIYHYSSVLEFGLQNEFEEFVEFLYLPNEIKDTDGRKVPVGSFLLATFEDVVIPKLLGNFQEFVTFSISKREFMSKCVSYLKSISTYISKYRGNVLWPNIVMDGLACHWETFKTTICEDTSKLAEGLELISILSSVKNAKKTELLVSSLFSSILEIKDFSAPENSFESRLEIFECLIKHLGLVFEQKHAVYFRAVMERIQTDVSESPDKNTQNLRLMRIGRLFSCLRDSRSTLLFRFIIQMYLKFPDFEQYMKDMEVFETYMKNLGEPEHLAIMITFRELIRIPEYPWDLKIKLVKDVMRTVFQKACLEAFKRYIKFDIKWIMFELRATVTEHNAGIKSVNFVLVEIMFARLPIGRDSEINTELMKTVSLTESTNPRGLLKRLLKYALETFSEDVPVTDRGNEEILRICRCCCYNTMVSIAVNAFGDPTFHAKLFSRMEGTEDILWSKIVDTRRRYVFEKNFDRLPTKKKILVNIKSNSTSSASVSHTKILRSQRIFNSSLSEDVTKHDLNNVTLRTESRSETREGNTEIEMDQVEVNDHECMPTICALVNHLAEGGFLRCEGRGELPACFKGMRLVLLSARTPTNVKIFLVKMIENNSHIFADYADWFHEPIMKFIVEKCAGDELNFFITDLVIMLANWSDKYQPSNVYEQSLATRVIGFLFDKLSTERRDIFRYHLELTGVLMESWKGNIVVVDYFIADMLKAAEVYETDKEIHTFSLLLHNDLFPFDKDVIAKFLVLTSARLNSFKKAIYTPCSEMLGLFLKKSKERNVLTQHEEEIEKIVDRFWEIDTDKMGNILEGITIHHPEYLREKHVIRLFSRLGNVIPNSQYVFLKVMLRATSVLERVNDFRTERWEKYLNSESSDVQIITLSLIKDTLYLLEKLPSFRGIMQSICEKKNSPNDLCKKIAFDIVIQVYEEHLRDLGRFSDVVDLCKDALMDGLASENPEISQTVRDFWTHSNVLSENLTKRFVQSFSTIYKPKNEEVVLGNGVNFLLNLLKLDPEEAIFDHPLEDCNFEEYELSVNASTQHPYEVPMFADSFLDRPTKKSGSQFKFGELRATQDDFTFSATVQNPALSRFTSSQSSLFLTTQNLDDFKDPNDYPKSKVLKRRFLKSREKISEYCANFEVKSKIQRVQGRVKDAKERDRQVSITRKYRKGDFPDIQISLSAIVGPLQKLAAENSDVAKILYANLFENVKEKMSSDDWSRLSGAIATIFKTSFEFNTNLFRTLMDFVVASRSRIKLDPYLVTECCMSSSLVSTGTLIIESYLMEMDEMEPQVKRFKRTDASDECLHWIKLAELYKELNDWDVVCSIFRNKIPCDNLVKTAISAESRMLWTQARDLYRDVIEKDLTEDKKDFYFEAYFRCFAHLGQWRTISDNVRSMEGERYWDNLWDDDWKRKKLLPWYIKSEVNDMLFKDELSCSLLEDINAALSETRKAEHLKLTFPEELATLWILNEDVDSAEMYLRSSVDSFLSQWQILDPIFRNVRHKKLMNLRGTTTVYEFIDIYRMFGSVEIEKIFGHLELLWSNTRCANSCPTMMQEIAVLRYKQFLNLIGAKMSSVDDPQSYREKIKNWKLKLDLGIVESALRDSNFYMVRKYLQSHKNEPGIPLYLAKMMFVKSNYSKSTPEAITTIFKSLEMLTDLSKKETCSETRLKIQLTTFEIFGELSRILVNNEDLREDVTEKLERIIGGQGLESRGLQDYAANEIYQFLEMYTSPEGLKGISDKSISDAYLQISYYIMEKEEPVVDVLNKMVLRSMKLGASEARQLFPILLQQEHLGTTYRDVFKQESASVPTWMFLSWIPQLLANMNSENIHAIDCIVMRLTETYPQAIMYPYRLSRQNFDSQNSHLADIVQKMDSLLSNEDVDMFLRALGNVCVPEKKLSYYVERILKNVGNAEEMEKIRSFVLSEFYSERMNSNDSECLYGNAFTRIRSYEKYFASGTSDHLTKKMRELLPELKDKSGKQSRLLKDYSPYLADFCSTKAGMYLEIPGQYDGKSMPLPQYHVKIFKFHPEISVMTSLRKPVKLTVLGNNTREYSYLVKFGEDVRQDQRIEQLFQVMNDVFRKTEGYSQQISLETFEVIPLTSSLGLIRWVDKTIVMETFMKRCIKKFGKSFDAPMGRYAQYFLSSKRGVSNIREAYGESAKVHDRIKIISNFKRAVGEIDSDVLRRAFWNLSTSTESFIALRHNFMRSYAVMCTAHWILGIGDRHLNNILIGLEDGHVIGIDFGCAFGTATQMLAVPELIPFRLTPQIVAFMEPLGVAGHFRASMINTLNCLRKYKKLLVSTMSVFIKEPSLNWLEMKMTDRTADVASSSWFPNHKINQVKRKLEGINSTEIVKEDLKDGQVNEYLNAYCELVNGVQEHDYRAQVAKEGLSVEEQVDCLIDHARDYNLLGRTYAGWKPWV